VTGDVNIINLRAVVQYRIKSPVEYLFGACKPEELVRCVTEAALAEVVAETGIDELLTVAKGVVQEQAREEA